MIKNFTRIAVLSLVAVTGTLAVGAQSKMSFSVREIADAASSAASTRMAGELNSDAEQTAEEISILFCVKPGTNVSGINVPTLVINNVFGEVVSATISPLQLETLAKCADVTVVDLPEKAEIDLVHSRGTYQTGVTTVHRNRVGKTADGVDAELGRPYLGNGVVCALYDTGLDPNHINFRTGDDYDKTRVKAVYTYTSSSGTPSQSLTTEEEILDFTTEDATAQHGTHVLGIMAGSFNGTGTYEEYVFYGDATTGKNITDSLNYLGNSYSLYKYTDRKFPYYGMAPQSDIFIGCGPLYTNNMLDIAQKAVDYGKANGKPVVINFSIGNTVGPKDGSSAFNRALAEIGKDAIICMSSSNSGNSTAWITKTFTEEDNTVKTILESVASTSALTSGTLDVWSETDEAFETTFFILDAETGETQTLTSLDGPITGYTNRRVISSNYSRTSTTTDYVVLDAWDEAYNGYFSIYSDVMSQNNRYEMRASFSTCALATDNESGNKVLCVEIKGKPGQTVYINANEKYFLLSNSHGYKETTDSGTASVSKSFDGYTTGNGDNSVNDLACGENVFVVGSYVNRQRYGVIKTLYSAYPTGSGGGKIANNYVPQDIAPSSGYAAKMADGRTLPHVATPGANIVSSNNTYYIDLTGTGTSSKYPESNTGFTTHNDKSYFWCNMSGTSMASPTFAGICALWLEADNTLKWDDIYDVIQNTCRKDDYTQASPVRFGAGKADAYEGMKYILKNNGVAPVYNAGENLMVENTADGISVFVGEGETFTASVYNLNGVCVAAEAGQNEVLISKNSLQPGVYVVNIHNDKIHKSTKIVVK